MSKTSNLLAIIVIVLFGRSGFGKAGFFPLDYSEIPNDVRSAALSVFQIEIPAFEFDLKKEDGSMTVMATLSLEINQTKLRQLLL